MVVPPEEDLVKTIRKDIYKELNNIINKNISPEEWTHVTSTTDVTQPPLDSYLGQLHFDINTGELFVTVKGRKGKEEKVIIENINDFKKLATKKLLRK